MKQHRLFFCALALSLLFAASISSSGAQAGVKIGDQIEDFSLPDVDGKEHSLSSLKGAKGIVLIFIATRCPVSNGYNERMKKLAEEYKARGINVVGINSNTTEPAAEVKQHATEHGLSFTILKDTGNKIADRFGASVTPEAFLLDASGKLVYHGRIDNSQKIEGVTTQDLREAIEATLAGREVARSQARAFGCTIKRAS